MSVQPTCPACGRRLRAVQTLSVATTTARRTCAGCRARWQVIVRPVSDRGGVRIDVADLTRI